MAGQVRTVVVAGGGLGGLMAGAMLSREGVRVTVLEKNDTAGGGLQSFKRRGVMFDTGMHVLGGFGPGGSIDRICRYLGIRHRLRIVPTDPDCMDTVTYGSDGMTYRLPSGRDRFAEALTGYFPDESAGIRAYVDELYAMADEVDLFNLRPTGATFTTHSERFIMPADELIASHLRDPRLRDLAAYINPLYSGMAGHTPAYIHALISVLYINGSARFAGGSSHMAEALADVISDGGGEVLTNCEVTAIDIADRHVSCVRCADGRQFTADRYIAAIHPCELLRIIPEGALPRAYRSRLHDIADTASAYILFIKLKPQRIPYINHTCYYQDDYGLVWSHADHDVEWPRGFMYMTPPDSDGATDQYATHMLVNCLMNYDEVSRWAHTSTGRRGRDYETWKRATSRRVLDKLELAVPGINDAIEQVWDASPLTIRDYYRTRNGSIFGYRTDCCNLMLSQLPVVTKIDNLLLTGQNNNLHGICGVPLTAINTVEAILGTNYIINRINDIDHL